jgi:hypothetical protein
MDYLINKLNYINFQNGTIQVVMSHRRFERTLTAKARPLPCSDKRLECVWLEPEIIERLVDNYEFAAFYVDDGTTALMVEPLVIRMDAVGLEVELPERCWEIKNRREPVLFATVSRFKSYKTVCCFKAFWLNSARALSSSILK